MKLLDRCREWKAFRRDRQAWFAAQKVHQMEHFSKLPLSLPCIAVGPWDYTDYYSEWFDSDAQRKFLNAGGGL